MEVRDIVKLMDGNEFVAVVTSVGKVVYSGKAKHFGWYGECKEVASIKPAHEKSAATVICVK